jgi:hypothetical protein
MAVLRGLKRSLGLAGVVQGNGCFLSLLSSARQNAQPLLLSYLKSPQCVSRCVQSRRPTHPHLLKRAESEHVVSNPNTADRVASIHAPLSAPSPIARAY